MIKASKRGLEPNDGAVANSATPHLPRQFRDHFMATRLFDLATRLACLRATSMAGRIFNLLASFLMYVWPIVESLKVGDAS